MKQSNPILHIASRIFDTPLMITSAKLDTIMAVLADRLGIQTPPVSGLAAVDMPEQRAASTIELSKPGSSPVKVGVIPVYGTLVHRASGLDALSGLRSYESVRQDFQAALNSGDQQTIIFDCATPGGEARGCFDLVEEIYQARGQGIQIIGVANEYAYSAGYALLSACDQVFVTRTAGVGSIGVIARHLDRSAKNEQEGLKYTTMFMGDRKNDFSQDAPLSGEAQTVLQNELVLLYDLFVDTVARNMDIKTSAVRNTQAGLFTGEMAVERGLAHEVLSFEQVINRIAETSTTTPTGGSFMSTENKGLQHQLEALFKGSSDAENAAALEPLGYVPAGAKINEEEVRSGAKKEGYQEALAYANDIYGLCILGGMPQMAGALIEKEATVEEARKEILDARADADRDSQLNSNVGPVGTGAISPLAADAQTRADKPAK